MNIGYKRLWNDFLASDNTGKQIISIWDGDVRIEGGYIHIDGDKPVCIHPELSQKIRMEFIKQALKAVDLAGKECASGD